MEEKNEALNTTPVGSIKHTMKKKSFWFLAAGVLILLLLFIFMIIGYKLELRTAEISAQAEVLQPKYKYEYWGEGDVRGVPSSVFVDIKVSGSDEPLLVDAPGSYEVSWEIADSLKGGDCTVYGPDAVGDFFEMPVTDDGALLLHDVVFGDMRAEGDVDTYTIGCMITDEQGREIEEMDEVEVILVSPAEEEAGTEVDEAPEVTE